MPKICQAGITRTYKRGKSDCVWPNYTGWNDDLPRCGGTVTFSVAVEGGGCCAGNDYCYCESPYIEVTASCTKCKDPWYEGMKDYTSRYAACELFEKWLNEHD